MPIHRDINTDIRDEHPKLWQAINVFDEARIIEIARSRPFPREADRLALLLDIVYGGWDVALNETIIPEQCLQISKLIGQLLLEIYGGAIDAEGKLFAALDAYSCWVISLIAAGTDLSADSLMIYAVQHGDRLIIKELLQAGAKVNVEWSGTTPLIHGSFDKAIVQILVEAGADVNWVTNEGRTALSAVREFSKNPGENKDFSEIEEILIKAGAIH